MKKLFTSLMALTMVLSATAKNNLLESKLPSIKKESKEIMVKTEKAPISASAKQTPAKSLLKMPKFAKAATQDVDWMNLVASKYEYYDSDGDWWFCAAAPDGSLYMYIDRVSAKEDQFGTYTEGFDYDYTYIADYSTGVEKDKEITVNTFTISIDEEGAIHASGTIVYEGETIDFAATSAAVEKHESSTIYVNATTVKLSYYDEDSDWYIQMSNDDYKVNLDIISEDGTFDGTYTLDDMLKSYTIFKDLNENETYGFEKLTATLKSFEGYEPSEACSIEGTGITSTGDTIVFTALLAPPAAPKDTIKMDVDLVTCEWPNEDGGATFVMKDKNNADINLQIVTKKSLGSYDLTGFDKEETLLTIGEDVYQIVRGNIRIAFDPATMALSVEGKVVMSDENCYTFAFDKQFELKGEKSLEFTNLEIDDSYASFFGIYMFDASNEEAAIEGMFDDEFTEDNFFADLTVIKDGEEVLVEALTLTDLEGPTGEDGRALIAFKMLGDDMVLYTVRATKAILPVTDTISIVIPEAELTDLIEDLGAFQISGYSASQTEYASLVFETEQIVGDYTAADFGAYTKYAYIALNITENDFDKYDFEEGTFKVTLEDDKYIVTGEVKAGQYWVKLSMTADSNPPVKGDQYDESENDWNLTFASEDVTYFEYDDEYNYYYVSATNMQNERIAILMYTEGDELTPGVYPINDSFEAGTVQPGQISNGSIYPSFAGTIDEDGYINVPLFLLNAGTVTVSEDADKNILISVDATNTWNKNLKATITVTNAINGIEELAAIKASADAVKVMQKNAISIKKGNKAYTISGIEIK